MYLNVFMCSALVISVGPEREQVFLMIPLKHEYAASKKISDRLISDLWILIFKTMD